MIGYLDHGGMVHGVRVGYARPVTVKSVFGSSEEGYFCAIEGDARTYRTTAYVTREFINPDNSIRLEALEAFVRKVADWDYIGTCLSEIDSARAEARALLEGGRHEQDRH